MDKNITHTKPDIGPTDAWNHRQSFLSLHNLATSSTNERLSFISSIIVSPNLARLIDHIIIFFREEFHAIDHREFLSSSSRHIQQSYQSYRWRTKRA